MSASKLTCKSVVLGVSFAAAITVSVVALKRYLQDKKSRAVESKLGVTIIYGPVPDRVLKPYKNITPIQLLQSLDVGIDQTIMIYVDSLESANKLEAELPVEKVAITSMVSTEIDLSPIHVCDGWDRLHTFVKAPRTKSTRYPCHT